MSEKRTAQQVVEYLVHTDVFLALKRDCRSILMRMVAAADFSNLNNYFSFPCDENIALAIEASVKTAQRRIDDIQQAGLIEKIFHTNRIRLSQKMLDLCKIDFQLTEPNGSSETQIETPSVDSLSAQTSTPDKKITLATMARKAQPELKHPRVVVENGQCVVKGEMEPVVKVSLTMPKWLHKYVRDAAYENGLTLAATLNTIVYKHFCEPD
jgi:hypothetical protein